MAYDEDLARRFGDALEGMAGISEKRMMGGICFMLNGNMIGGADQAKDGTRRFMFRVGKGNHHAGLELPGAIAMEQGGRKMSGFFFVEEEGCSDSDLRAWLSLAISHAAELPAK